MFAKATNVGFAQRVVATLVASAVVLASYGVYTTAQAANLTDISNTLTNSAPGELSGHEFAFSIPTGSSLTTGDTVSITFPAGFSDVATLVSGDLTVTVEGGAAVAIGNFTAVGQVISFDNVAANAEEEVIVAIADDVVTNPTKVNADGVGDSYEFEVTTGTDTGKTRVAIIDTVQVTAVVETTFDFTIAGTASSSALNSDTTTGTTSATEIPFGILTAGAPKVLSQQLNVQTNARNGFSVTVETDGDLQSSTGAVIDNFVDSSDVAVAGTAWTAPSNVITDETTWGHWGMTSDDADLADEMVTGSSYIAASTTPREVFSHDGPSDGSTDNVGEAIVGYKVEITALQEAGDDYNTTLTYIATPTF
jgi:hypothetical protein